MKITTAAAGLLGLFVAGTAAQHAANTSVIYQLSSDVEFGFILEEYMLLANGGGTATGEVLRAASQITPGDFESWYGQFKFLADSLHNKSLSIDAKRFPVSARETLFRAASYYRGADFFLHANWSDPRINSLWASALADYNAAVKLLPNPGELVSVNAPAPNNFTVPFVFFPGATPGQLSSAYDKPIAGVGKQNKTRNTARKLPTIIAGTGYDGSKEAQWHSYGREVVDRGYNFVTYEGPGQPQVVREQNLGFIDNWWDVVSPIIDYLETRDDVDMDRIALAGFSFGGTLAPRAASREHRLSAVIAVDGLVDLQTAILTQFGPELAGLYTSGNESAFNSVLLQMMNDPTADTQARWLIAQSLWSFRTESPFDWMNKLGTIVADAAVLANITCPVFVAEGEDDSGAPGQPGEMARLLGSKATYNLFRTNLGAGEHCQIGAEAQLAQVTLDWLADVWDGVHVPTNSTDITYRKYKKF